MGPKTEYKELMAKGAVVIDVRSPSEYRSGHMSPSLNIPLDTLSENTGKIKKDVPVITVCASGMRSASAKRTLESLGFKEVYNGGSWNSLKNSL